MSWHEELRESPTGKGSRASTLLPAAQQVPCLPPAQTHAVAEVLGKYTFILKCPSLAGGVHPTADLLPSPKAAVTQAMEEGWEEGQREKPGKEK